MEKIFTDPLLLATPLLDNILKFHELNIHRSIENCATQKFGHYVQYAVIVCV